MPREIKLHIDHDAFEATLRRITPLLTPAGRALCEGIDSEADFLSLFDVVPTGATGETEDDVMMTFAPGAILKAACPGLT